MFKQNYINHIAAQELMAFILKNFQSIISNQYKNSGCIWDSLSLSMFGDAPALAPEAKTISRWSTGTFPSLENLERYLKYMDKFDDVKECIRKLQKKYPGLDIKRDFESYLIKLFSLPKEDIKGIIKYYRKKEKFDNEVGIVLVQFVVQNMDEIIRHQYLKIRDSSKKIAQNNFGEARMERTIINIVKNNPVTTRTIKMYFANLVKGETNGTLTFENRVLAMVLDYMVELQEEYPDTDIKEAFCAYVKRLLSFSDTEIKIIMDYYRRIK